MSSKIPALHLRFIERVRDEVARDSRMAALLAGGSYVHGGFDDHSDLDFVIVVQDESYGEVMASRREFAEGLGNLLAAFTGEHVGESRLLICLYGPTLIHVDLKFVKSSDLSHLVERPAVLFARDPAKLESVLEAAAIEWPEAPPEWFEQRAWIWLHYGATKLARGEMFEALGMLAFFGIRCSGRCCIVGQGACSVAFAGSSCSVGPPLAGSQKPSQPSIKNPCVPPSSMR